MNQIDQDSNFLEYVEESQLVSGFNPFRKKYARQIASSPQVGVKIPKIFETTIQIQQGI